MMVTFLQSFIDQSKFGAREPKLSGELLFSVLPSMKEEFQEENVLTPLVQFLEREYEAESTKYTKMAQEGLVSFDALQFIFQRGIILEATLSHFPGKRIYGYDGSYFIGSVVARTYYNKESTFDI